MFFHVNQAHDDSVATHARDQAQNDVNNKEEKVPQKQSDAARVENAATKQLVSNSETKETETSTTAKIQLAKEKGVEEMHRIASTEVVKYYNLYLKHLRKHKLQLVKICFLKKCDPTYSYFYFPKIQVDDQHMPTDDQDHAKQKNDGNNEAEHVQQQHNDALEEQNAPADEQAKVNMPTNVEVKFYNLFCNTCQNTSCNWL